MYKQYPPMRTEAGRKRVSKTRVSPPPETPFHSANLWPPHKGVCGPDNSCLKRHFLSTFSRGHCLGLCGPEFKYYRSVLILGKPKSFPLILRGLAKTKVLRQVASISKVPIGNLSILSVSTAHKIPGDVSGPKRRKMTKNCEALR